MPAATIQGGAPTMPVFETMLAKYGWIWVGLTFGFAAKYALLIKRGIKVQPRLVLADILLLPLVALIAYWMATRAGVESEARALVTAFCAVGADRLVKLLTDRFINRVDSEARQLADELMGVARQTVQAERSASNLIEDTIEGRAPAEYEALKPRKAPKQ